MTSAKAKKAEPVVEAPVEPEGPIVETEVTWNGLTAHDTIDGVEQAPRTATLSEQLPMIAQELLSLVVGSVPYASTGSIDVDGTVVTITLVSH